MQNKVEPKITSEVAVLSRVYKPPMKMKNGATYSGQWLNGLMDGKGMLE